MTARILWIIAAAAVAACIFSSSAPAGETIGMHLGSVHFGQGSRSMNGFNPGIYRRSEAGWTVGGYWNSNRHVSLYAGRTFDLFGEALQLTAGGITGYHGARVLPFVAPSVKLGGGFRMAFLPKTPKTVATIHLMWEAFQ